MKDYILQTYQLTKTYGQNTAVNSVNMTVSKGDIYGFIGKNGAGKTTLIRMATGLIHPSTGSLSLFGNDSQQQQQAADKKRIGAIVETPSFYPRMTARDNLEYYRIQRGIPNKDAVEVALQTVNLSDTGKKRYGQFSLGMKQRLGLALAIMGRPDFLILDEPINGLDPTGIIEFREIIKRLHNENNMTVLISSHILSELTQVATRYGIIHNGILLKEFTQKQLDSETQQYLSVKVNDAALAAVILEEKLNITNFEILPEQEIHIYSNQHQPSDITFQLSSNCVQVHSLTAKGTNLEDYFIKTIGEAI